MDLFKALEALGKEKNEDDAQYRLRLKKALDKELKKVDKPQGQANICRLQLGFVLLAERPEDGRLKWQRERAKELGFTGKDARSIRGLIGAAEELEATRTDENGLARNVPIEIVKRPWAQVKNAIKVFRETGKVEGKMPPKPVTPDMALKGLERALKKAMRVVPQGVLKQWLQAAVVALGNVEEADDGEGPGETVAKQDADGLTLAEGAAAYLDYLSSREDGNKLASSERWYLKRCVAYLGKDHKIGLLKDSDISVLLPHDRTVLGEEGRPLSADSLYQTRAGLKRALQWWRNKGWTKV